VTTPAALQKPGARWCYRRIAAEAEFGDDSFAVRQRSETVEVIDGGERIGPITRGSTAELREMPAVIVEYVKQAAPDFERRLEDARVVTIGKEAAASTKLQVEAAREPNREPLHCARQGGFVIRLHQQMEMVVLDAEVDEPDAKTLARLSKDGKNDAPEPLRSKVFHVVPHA
jgi:hypothetical protein